MQIQTNMANRWNNNSWWKGCAKGGIFQMISLVTESENLKLIDVVSDHKGIREMDSKREKEKKKGKIGQERILRMNLERKRFSQTSMQLLCW